MSERLAELLRAAAPEPVAVPFEEVVHRVRRRRRSRLGTSAGVLAVIVAAAVVPLVVVHRSPSTAITVAPTPSAPPDRVVTYDRISVRVPAGWSLSHDVDCGPQNRIVSYGAVIGASCAARPPGPPISAISIVASPVLLTIANDEHQDATAHVTHLMVDGVPGRLVFGGKDLSHPSETNATLLFDLLDAEVRLSAPDATQFQALLARVSVFPATSLEVPASVTQIVVGADPTLAINYQSIVSDRARILAVVDALRSAPLLPLSTPVCQSHGTPFTLVGGLTYTVLFGPCNEVIAGNGTIARVTPQLSAAVVALS